MDPTLYGGKPELRASQGEARQAGAGPNSLCHRFDRGEQELRRLGPRPKTVSGSRRGTTPARGCGGGMTAEEWAVGRKRVPGYGPCLQGKRHSCGFGTQR